MTYCVADQCLTDYVETLDTFIIVGDITPLAAPGTPVDQLHIDALMVVTAPAGLVECRWSTPPATVDG